MTELLKKDKKFEWTSACEASNRSDISDARYGEVVFYLL
jgi:hypothetical protein